MVTYKFIRTTVKFEEDGSVKFTECVDDETIQVATDWLEGKEHYGARDKEGGASQKHNYTKTGYIGEGYSKYGIYVRRFIMPNM